jgi:hypothetical protein
VIDGTEFGMGPTHLSGGFRVLRSPRPLAGESMLQLHRDVYIDLANSYPCPINYALLPIDPPPGGTITSRGVRIPFLPPSDSRGK